ncbi:hypothetical protein [Chitinophaga solisilvae]|uniref:Uncharacterized protein n=1 Tax=Chitinophaga solisilvae TaxID=1233460 RepID=A0A3S1B4X2_9BACT|nr:hypothetical protein [Chitinophaga solisilvae]NSL86071.1 hypothetical protein [Chitinophaga solisilvae]
MKKIIIAAFAVTTALFSCTDKDNNPSPVLPPVNNTDSLFSVQDGEDDDRRIIIKPVAEAPAPDSSQAAQDGEDDDRKIIIRPQP